jgi:hypothetical protein
VANSGSTEAPLPEGPYVSAWREYRRRRIYAVLSYLAIPASIAVFGAFGGQVGPAMAFTFFGAAAVVIIAAGRLAYWQCPRCRNFFSVKNWHGSRWAIKCVHCGLNKYDGGP